MSNYKLKHPVSAYQCHGIRAGNNREKQSIDQCANVNLASSSIEVPRNDSAQAQIDKQCPAKHYPGAIKSYYTIENQTGILVIPNIQEADDIK